MFRHQIKRIHHKQLIKSHSTPMTGYKTTESQPLFEQKHVSNQVNNGFHKTIKHMPSHHTNHKFFRRVNKVSGLVKHELGKDGKFVYHEAKGLINRELGLFKGYLPYVVIGGAVIVGIYVIGNRR